MDEQPVETTTFSLDGKTPQPLQRRESERHLSLLRVGTLHVGDRRELCLIRNVSAGGMMVRAYSDIREGETLAVELKQGDAIAGTVIWTSNDCLGISFAEPIDIVDFISASGEGPRPRMPRIEIRCPALVREDGTVHRVEALNISQGGLKVASRKPLTVGAEVTATLGGLAPIAGVVRWRDDELYGITFNRVLALPTLVAWLKGQQEEPLAQRAVG